MQINAQPPQSTIDCFVDILADLGHEVSVTVLRIFPFLLSNFDEGVTQFNDLLFIAWLDHGRYLVRPPRRVDYTTLVTIGRGCPKAVLSIRTSFLVRKIFLLLLMQGSSWFLRGRSEHVVILRWLLKHTTHGYRCEIRICRCHRIVIVVVVVLLHLHALIDTSVEAARVINCDV